MGSRPLRSLASLAFAAVACAPSSPAAPAAASSPAPASAAPAAPEAADAAVAAPTATSDDGGGASPARRLDLRLRKRTPVACNGKQTNVPCVYARGARCFLRTANCDAKPCEEGEHRAFACDAVARSLPKPTRVCLDVTNAKDVVIRVYQEDSRSESGYGPSPLDRVRLCANDPADRPWKIEDAGDLDWTKDACFTLDASTRAIAAGCTRYDGPIVEGRL